MLQSLAAQNRVSPCLKSESLGGGGEGRRLPPSQHLRVFQADLHFDPDGKWIRGKRFVRQSLSRSVIEGGRERGGEVLGLHRGVSSPFKALGDYPVGTDACPK